MGSYDTIDVRLRNSGFTSSIFVDCTSLWSERTYISTLVSTENYVANPNPADVSSARIVVDGSFGTGLLSDYSFTPVDLSSYHQVGFWIAAERNVGANVLQFYLDNGVANIPIDVPKLIGREWQFVSKIIEVPAQWTSIESVGIVGLVDFGGLEFYIDGVVAETANWPLNYNPVHAIWQCLLKAGLLEEWLDAPSFLAAATTVYGEELGVSINMRDYQECLTYLKSLLAHIGAVLFYGVDSKLHIKLMRTDYVVGDLPVVDVSVLLGDPTIDRPSWLDTTGEIKIQYNRLTEPERTAGIIGDDIPEG